MATGVVRNVNVAGTYGKSVLSALQDDRANNRTRSQYRLRFAKLTDGDGNTDLAYLRQGEPPTSRPCKSPT
ncbi:hypothetical protein GCM10010840_03170 [Deinococcus aerolatus]|uniref:Uncharacterized protein n=1 Tax=Deinococcus aerolatus TaxID=522487 RepID=A0ABQ2G079_9DEIO|nr:hypothetical protein [Deinococcus aerolatus]GGL68486.1 hypothetical protein GCM10010840_03170 [Deinococcus aerolatus]